MRTLLIAALCAGCAHHAPMVRAPLIDDDYEITITSAVGHCDTRWMVCPNGACCPPEHDCRPDGLCQYIGYDPEEHFSINANEEWDRH